MGIRDEWLNDDEVVVHERLFNRYLEYIKYVTKHFPDVNTSTVDYLDKNGF